MDANGRREELIPLKEHDSSQTSNIKEDAGPKTTPSTSTIVLRFILILFAVVSLTVVIFFGGFLAGRSAFCNADKNPPPISTPVWGGDVVVGGKAVPVMQWLDSEIQAENIRENLRLGMCIDALCIIKLYIAI